MKKIYIFIIVPLVYFFSTATMYDTTPWRKQFASIDHQNLKNRLGYNPQLQLIKDTNRDTTHECVTVYFHGWLAAGNANTVLSRIEHIPGDKIIFNFEDASSWLQVPQWITQWTGIKTVPYFIPRIWKSSLAQEKEINDALIILDTLYHAGIHEFVFYGQSRGGGVVTALPGFLNKTIQEQENQTRQDVAFTPIDEKITFDTLKNILQGIKIVYADAPLKDVKTALNIHPFEKIFTLLGRPSYLEDKIVPALSLYKSTQRSPIMWITNWPKNLPVAYFPQYNDPKVGNDDDELFAEQLLLKNPRAYICPLNNGGHEKGIESIRTVIHCINKPNGGSYNGLKTNSQQETLKTIQFDQNISNVKTFINNYYAAERNKQTSILQYLMTQMKFTLKKCF